MKVLFIDDEPESVLDAQEELREYYPNSDIVTLDFEEGQNDIWTIRPQIVVLDIWKDDAITGTAQGLDVFDFIWDHCFCPVIVYSANTEITESYANIEHPFVKVVTKGSESEVLVRNAVCGLTPHIEAIKTSESHVSQNFASAMRDVAPYAFCTFDDPEQITDAIVRGGRRRVAALMDEPPSSGTRLASWEKYLSPPVTKNLRLGDVLHDGHCGYDEPASFRVVLTPSCDLVAAGNQTPNVHALLAAKCCPMGVALDKTGIGTSRRKIKGSRILTQGYYDGFIPFPSLPGKIPTMAANLRDLQLIPLTEIGDEGERFTGVASVDSPFRELISWAYLQIAGRPGLPDRDLQPWLEQIIESIDGDQVVESP